MRHDESDDDDDCKPEHANENGKNAADKRSQAASWWTPAWLRLGDERQVALQERIFRDHQRQLDDVSKQVASGSYTPQSLVSELWTFWSRVVGDQADMIRVAAGLKAGSRGEKGPRVYAFSMALGDESRSFTLRLESDQLPPDRPITLNATALRSPDYRWEISSDLISFKPAKVERDVRGEVAVEITFAQIGRSGNQIGPGYYVGTLQADETSLGLLVLEITDQNANLGS